MLKKWFTRCVIGTALTIVLTVGCGLVVDSLGGKGVLPAAACTQNGTGGGGC
jgi:hypothetical protein